MTHSSYSIPVTHPSRVQKFRLAIPDLKVVVNDQVFLPSCIDCMMVKDLNNTYLSVISIQSSGFPGSLPQWEPLASATVNHSQRTNAWEGACSCAPITNCILWEQEGGADLYKTTVQSGQGLFFNLPLI